jgi:cardiolipin synthase
MENFLGVNTNEMELVVDEKFKKRLTKKQIFSIPNILSFIRILLIPVIIVLYCTFNQHIIAAGVVVLSALTDVVDGFIARRYNMITDLGKFLDPLADKLTQAAMIICVATKNWWIVFLLVIMLVRELLLFIWGLLFFKKNDAVNSSRWYGKLSTVVVYLSMFVIFLLPTLGIEIIKTLFSVCVVVVALSAVLYGNFYLTLFRKHKKEQNNN